jgi:hypothetical protein
LQARLVVWTLGHAFGSSRKSFRTQPEGDDATINFPVVLKQALLEAGGYDEQLSRNQDNDMEQKLRAKGYKLYCTWKTECFYYPIGTVKGLLRYGFRNGFWAIISLKKNSKSMGTRHFIPFLFLSGLLGSLLLAGAAGLSPAPYRLMGLLPCVAILGLHLAVGLLAALQVAVRERSPGALWLPLVFLGFHLAYGFGTLSALVSKAKPSASAPERLRVARA